MPGCRDGRCGSRTRCHCRGANVTIRSPPSSGIAGGEALIRECELAEFFHRGDRCCRVGMFVPMRSPEI
jgi:hypothetical protein